MKKFFLYFSAFITIASLTFYSAPYVRSKLIQSGVIEEEVPIAGTGSMYPTFPKGTSIDDKVNAKETVATPRMKYFPTQLSFFGHTLFSYKLQKGDIVEFENSVTDKITKEKYGEATGFVKRIAGTPGDEIELRDGYLKINGKISEEPYISKPRSTYGGSFVPDCKKIEVPPDSVFVLGDNRKASLDSRHDVGFVKISSISHVIPFNEQDKFRQSWRDTSHDTDLANTSTLDGVRFVKLINENRIKKKLKPYNYNSSLVKSSFIRGSAMIKFNDFSVEATTSGIDLNRATKDAGYSNILLAELSSLGYYDADELIDNIKEFGQSDKFLYSKEYQDIGLSTVLGDINKCPVQVIVIHMGGYVPPNYRTDQVKNWDDLVTNLEKVIPSWEKLKDVESVDKTKLNSLLELFNTRLRNAKRVTLRMHANQWLTEEEKQFANNDKRLADDADRLIDEIIKK